MIFAFSFEGCPLVIACFWTSFIYFGAEKFSLKTAYFSSFKYEQESQTLSFKVGENLAQIRAKNSQKKEICPPFWKKQSRLQSLQK